MKIAKVSPSGEEGEEEEEEADDDLETLIADEGEHDKEIDGVKWQKDFGHVAVNDFVGLDPGVGELYYTARCGKTWLANRDGRPDERAPFINHNTSARKGASSPRRKKFTKGKKPGRKTRKAKRFRQRKSEAYAHTSYPLSRYVPFPLNLFHATHPSDVEQDCTMHGDNVYPCWCWGVPFAIRFQHLSGANDRDFHLKQLEANAGEGFKRAKRDMAKYTPRFPFPLLSHSRALACAGSNAF